MSKNGNQGSEDLSRNFPVYHPSNNIMPTEAVKKFRKKSEKLPVPDVAISPIDPIWQSVDPTPDIYGLFTGFDNQFFGGKLSAVEVKWSSQMTLCAGICVFEGGGGLCSIRLSAPLLKFRPRSDLVETLLDRSSHGPKFRFHMDRINKCAKTNITVYHSFHDEVDFYRVHWWKCNGPCSQLAPYYGIVRRSKNRPPGPNDQWWSQHQLTCGGQFVKIMEPENYKNAAKKPKKDRSVSKSQKTFASTQDIRKFTNISPKSVERTENDPSTIPTDKVESPQPLYNFPGVGRRLGSLSSSDTHLPSISHPQKITSDAFTASADNQSSIGFNLEDFIPKKSIECPVCSTMLPSNEIDAHLDMCTSKDNVDIISDYPSIPSKLEDDVDKSKFDLGRPVASLLHSEDSPSANLDDFIPKGFVICPVCSGTVPAESLNNHLDACISNTDKHI